MSGAKFFFKVSYYIWVLNIGVYYYESSFIWGRIGGIEGVGGVGNVYFGFYFDFDFLFYYFFGLNAEGDFTIVNLVVFGLETDVYFLFLYREKGDGLLLATRVFLTIYCSIYSI